MDLGGRASGDVGLGAALRVDEVRGEESVNEGGLAETGLAWKRVSATAVSARAVGVVSSSTAIDRRDIHRFRPPRAVQMFSCHGRCLGAQGDA